MDFAKPGAPEMALTDINDIIRDAINLSEVTLRKKRSDWKPVMDPICPNAMPIKVDRAGDFKPY